MTDHTADHVAVDTGRSPWGLRGLLDALRRKAAASRAAAARFETLRQLSLLDETLLRDIGLTAGDVARMRRGAPIERPRRGVRAA